MHGVIRSRLVSALAALLVWVAPGLSERGDGAAPDPCSLCAGTKEIGCPTCAGSGRATRDCSECRAIGKASCPYCVIPAEVAAAIKVKLERGRFPCPNRYCNKKGVVTWDTKDSDPCKVCSGKGAYDCPMCDAGTGPCLQCGGKGRIERTCGDCAGSKKIPCPACAVTATGKSCPFCRQKTHRPCSLCNRPLPANGAIVKCRECSSGARPCSECRAFGRMPCDECGGTGRIRSVSGSSKAGRKTHELCKGTGWTACIQCKGGRIACQKCKDGNRTVTCAGCLDDKIVLCGGCFPGRWSAFETLGRVLHAASRFEEASAFYTAAVEKAGPASDVVVGGSVSDSLKEGLEKAIHKWRADARARIEAARDAAKAGKPPPPKPG